MSIDDQTFEARARRAAAGVNDAVASADLQLFTAGIPALQSPDQRTGWRLHGRERWMAAAGAFAAVLIVLGLALLPGQLFAPDGDVATTEPIVPDGILTPIETAPDSEPGPATTLEATPETTTSTHAEESVPTEAVDTTPPEISVTAPEDGVVTSESLMQFHGVTEPGARVVAAGEWDADVDAEGNWEIILGLNSGSNIVTFTAIDAAGNEATTQITVNFDPPSPTTTTTKPEGEPGGEEGGTDGEAHDFSAFAQFETCEENPPFNIYWGTANPGEKITIDSAYGEGVVYADETGNWEIRVEFPEAPHEQAFVVTVRNVDTGESQGFELVSLAG